MECQQINEWNKSTHFQFTGNYYHNYCMQFFLNKFLLELETETKMA
jgi:hypothetical protein